MGLRTIVVRRRLLCVIKRLEMACLKCLFSGCCRLVVHSWTRLNAPPEIMLPSGACCLLLLQQLFLLLLFAQINFRPSSARPIGRCWPVWVCAHSLAVCVCALAYLCVCQGYAKNLSRTFAHFDLLCCGAPRKMHRNSDRSHEVGIRDFKANTTVFQI